MYVTMFSIESTYRVMSGIILKEWKEQKEQWAD